MRLSFIAAALASAIALCEGSTKMVIGYFPNWLYASYPVENIPFSKYTHINYAFAILNNEDNLPSFTDDWAVESSLPKVVQMAHGSQTKVLLSVGGWTGSKRFSPMVATAENRKRFIDWNLDFIEKYNTDGVDLDWEYPGKQAAGCNEFADNDADNFLLLLKELRQALDAKFPEVHKEISMAVHVQPFVKSGVPMTDLQAFVPYFDHVNLMTYDINGAWASTTGPNAPFQAQEGKGAPFSFVDSIRDWKKAGVPANKITAGLAFYGRTMKVKTDITKELSQFQEIEAGAPKGDSDDAYWNDPYCNVEPAGFSGIWKWTNLRKEGVLKDDLVTPGEGWQRNWDEVSQTPWLFNPSLKHFISYDDPQSLNIKVQHAVCEDLAGVMVWDIHQDNGELLETVNKIHTMEPASCAALLKDSLIETSTGAIASQPESISMVGEPLAVYPEEVPAAPITTSRDAYSLNGTPCSAPGQSKCVNSGRSGQWLTCNYDTWLLRECVSGLVCNDGAAGQLYCDYPDKTAMKAQAPVPGRAPIPVDHVSKAKPALSSTPALAHAISSASMVARPIPSAHASSEAVPLIPASAEVVRSASIASDAIPSVAAIKDTIPSASAAANAIPSASAAANAISSASAVDVVSSASVADAIPSASVVDAIPSASVADAIPSASVVDAIPSASVADTIPSASVADVIPSASVVDAIPSASIAVEAIPSASVVSEVRYPASIVSETSPFEQLSANSDMNSMEASVAPFEVQASQIGSFPEEMMMGGNLASLAVENPVAEVQVM